MPLSGKCLKATYVIGKDIKPKTSTTNNQRITLVTDHSAKSSDAVLVV